MSDVFISYSRQDRAFVRQLHSALAKMNRDTWVDWEDIPLTSKWLAEIYDGIEKANIFIFVISPDSVASNTCNAEIDHAVKYNKRIVPIMRRDVPDKDVPEALRSINWTFIRETDDFANKFQELIKALDTDLDWVKTHTRLLVRAIDWDKKERDNSLVLHGRDLRDAEEWLAQSATGKNPTPTSLQAKYILASRKSAISFQRRILGAISFALIVTFILMVVAVTLGVLAWIQRNDAISRELAANAISQLQTDPELSVLLAMEATKVASTEEAGDSLRQSLLASHVRVTLRGHTDSVISAMFSPDGSLILTSSKDGSVRLWEASSGRNRAVFRGAEGTFSSDGEFIITIDDKTVWIWETKTSQKLSTIQLGGPACDYERGSEVFSPDTKLVAIICRDGIPRVWELKTGSMVEELRGHVNSVNSIKFTIDGKRIVTASEDKTARVWEVETSKMISELRGHTSTVISAVFSPDGKFVVTASDDGTARVWEVETGTTKAELRGHASRVTSAAFGRGGRLVITTSEDRTARIWETETGMLVAELPTHRSGVWNAAFSPDGKSVVTVTADNTARLWDVETGRFIELLGHTKRVSRASFSPDGKFVLTASEDNTARVWDAAAEKSIVELVGHTSLVSSATFSPNGQFVLTASDDKTARVWQKGKGTVVAELRGHTGAVTSAAFSPDSKLVLTGSGDRTARVWEVDTGKTVAEMRGHTDAVIKAAFSPNGQLIVTASNDRTARVWKTGTEEAVAELHGHTDALTTVAFSPDSKLVLTGSYVSDRTARVWEAATGKLVAVLRGHTSRVISAVFSPDGKSVVTTSDDKTARIWETTTGKMVAELRGHTGEVLNAAFSPDSRIVVTASVDGTARIWEAATGKMITELRGHTSTVRTASFSPNGKFVVTASDDTTARVWQVTTGKTISQLHGHSSWYSWILSAAFSPDGKFVVTASGDGITQIYACEVCSSTEELLALAHTRITRELSCEERQTYLHANTACSAAMSTSFPEPQIILKREATIPKHGSLAMLDCQITPHVLKASRLSSISIVLSPLVSATREDCSIQVRD